MNDDVGVCSCQFISGDGLMDEHAIRIAMRIELNK